MLMDSRNDVLLNCTKDCNNLYNCRRIRFPKGNKEADMKEFLRRLYPSHNETLLVSDKQRIHRWEKSSSRSKEYYRINTNINDLTEVLECQPYELYFNSIDDCVIYEDTFLIQCFNKFEKEFEGAIKDKNTITNEEIIEFRRKLGASADYFYYQVVEMAVEVCRLFDIDIIKMETELEYKVLNGKIESENLDLRGYVFNCLNLSKEFLKNTLFKLYNVLGPYKFSDIRVFNKENSREKVETVELKKILRKSGIPQQEWNDIILHLNNKDDKSTRIKENYTIRYYKHMECSGNYFYKLVGRFFEYTKLLNYLPNNLDKSLEIVAANNWFKLFGSLITQLKVHAQETINESIRDNLSSEKGFHLDCKHILDYYNSNNFEQNTNKMNTIRVSENMENLRLGNPDIIQENFNETLSQLLIEYSRMNNTQLYNNFAYSFLRGIDVDFN